VWYVVIGRAYYVGTYAGSPLACAAALAVIRAFEEEGLLEQARTLGEHLTTRLHALKKQFSAIVDVRGLGAMVAFELFTADGKPDADLAAKLVRYSLQHGLILLACGMFGNVIRILVPLTASTGLVDEGLDIIAGGLRELTPAIGKAA